MQPHFYMIFVAALVPMIVGFLWYSKMLFGNAWMRVNRFTEEGMKGGNMALTFILCYVFSCLIAFVLIPVVIHQASLASIIQKDHTDAAKAWLEESMKQYGNNFRTFKHGMLHGTIAGIGFGLPIIGIPALFEKRGAKYIFIHLGYWVVTLALMGGVLCQWL